MENQTPFDLNAAIERWRQEVAAQSNLTTDNRRELELHLRVTVGELRQRGLNDEEAFWLARRRIGQPQPPAEEIVQADPAPVWRERAFWMWLALFASITFGRTINSIWNLMTARFVPGQLPRSFLITAATGLAISVLVPLIWVTLLAKGKLVSRLVADRRRWAMAVIACVVLFAAIQYFALEARYQQMQISGAMRSIVALVALDSVVIGLILIWLMPRHIKGP